MRVSYILSLIILCFGSIALGQNKIDIQAELNTEKNQIKISQNITYFNATSDTLQTIYLNDWSNSYSTKNTPLAMVTITPK